MNIEKWVDIKGRVKEQFSIINEGVEKDEESREEIEYVEFKSPMGLIRLEYISKPRVLDKKTSYSNRIGGDIKVDYVYSDTEIINFMRAYKEINGEWEEIESRAFSS